jgi:hypothetical protein
MRRIFDPNREEVREDWRKAHGEKFNNLWFSNTWCPKGS